jgi:hypothetical protein
VKSKALLRANGSLSRLAVVPKLQLDQTHARSKTEKMAGRERVKAAVKN